MARFGDEFMSDKPPPVLQALVLADHIYTEESGKRIICGTFSQIWCAQFPAMLNRPTWAYILLAEVRAHPVLQLRFVKFNDNRILMKSARIGIRAKSPLVPVDIAIEIPPFPLPSPGAYGVECLVDDTLIGCVRLQVNKTTETQGEQ